MQRNLAFKQNLLGSEREDQVPSLQRENRQWIVLPLQSIPDCEEEACVASSLSFLLPLRSGCLFCLRASQSPLVPGNVSIYGGLCLEVQLPKTGRLRHQPSPWTLGGCPCFIPFLFRTSVLLGRQAHLILVIYLCISLWPFIASPVPLTHSTWSNYFHVFKVHFSWNVTMCKLLFCDDGKVRCDSHIKWTINHLKVNNSGALSTFALLCKTHLIADVFITPKAT